MDAIKFYKTTENYLNKVAKSRGVTNLTKYYSLTDFHKGGFVNNYQELSQVFVQMAFHAQNATMISNIVNFEKNLAFLDKLTFGFEPKKFLKKYSSNDREKDVEKLVEVFRYDEKKNPHGLRWNSNKSKPKNKDAIAKRYANCLLDCSKYLSQFNIRQDVVDDLLKHYTNNDYRKLVKYFRKNIQSGYSVALTCDFLKEFDRKFDLPKPDIHIMDTLTTYYQYDDDYYKKNDSRAFECIDDFVALVEEINTKLKKSITVYQLDRMVWLICSGKFFLDNIQDTKTEYLKQI